MVNIMKENEHTLLVLGASSDQLFLIKTAQKIGLNVLVFDINPNSPGFSIANEYAVISTHDIDNLCGYLKEYKNQGKKIIGVITMGSDIPNIVATLSQHFGLPGISLETAYLATNKYEMKIRFRERGIPIPWFDEVHSVDNLKKVVLEQGYPLIIKPIDSSGSRGVFLLEEGCDLEELFTRSKAFSRSGRVQIEEFLEGLQISTETIMYRGKGVTPGFADRNYELLDQFRPQIMENGGWVPSILTAEERRKVEDLVVKASLALGVTDGVTKGDVVMTREGPKMIEMAARLSGGDFSESLVPLGTGINYVEAAIKIAIGENPELKKLIPKFHQSVANRYFFPNPGRLVHIDGIKEVLKQEWVKKLEFWYKVGDTVPPSLSHAHRFGVFVVVGDTRVEVSERVNWVYQTINIITEQV